jgi:hypothetical protein
LELKWSDIHVVFISWRNLASDVKDTTFFSSVQSLKIMDRKALSILYTKTLTSLPQLFLDEVKPPNKDKDEDKDEYEILNGITLKLQKPVKQEE